MGERKKDRVWGVLIKGVIGVYLSCDVFDVGGRWDYDLSVVLVLVSVGE